MSKTDKELTIEVVTNYINSWNNANSNTAAAKPKELIELIKSVHETIQNLPEKK